MAITDNMGECYMDHRSRVDILALELLLSGEVKERQFGICKSILRNDILEEAFKSWEHYSGNLSYPVPHPTLTPNDAYHRVWDLWDEETEYGRSRIALTKHCLAYFKEELERQ